MVPPVTPLFFHPNAISPSPQTLYGAARFALGEI
jgi:hypothetical protein